MGGASMPEAKRFRQIYNVYKSRSKKDGNEEE